MNPVTRRFSASLSSRIVLLVLFAIVPALGLLWRAAGRERENAAYAARRRALASATGAAREHERLVEGARVLLASLALRGVDEGASCPRLLADLRRIQPAFSNLAVAAGTGEVACSAVPLAHPTNVRGAAWFAEAQRRGEAVVADYDTAGVFGGSAFLVAYALPAADAAARRVAFAVLPLSWLAGLRGLDSLPDNASVSVVDTSGRIILRYPEPERWSGVRRPSSPSLRQVIERRRGTVDAVGLDGVARLYGFTPLSVRGSAPIFVSVGVPAAEAYAPATREATRGLATLGAVTLLTIAIALVMGHALILRRADALVLAAERISGGDYAARTGLPPSGDELGAVAGTFDRMAEILEHERERLARVARQLRRSRRRARQLARHLESGREEERMRISREVHDQLGGLLTAIKMDVAWMRGALQPEQAPLQERAGMVLGLVDEAVATVRRIASELRPGILDDLGLSAAIEWQAQEFARRTGIEVSLDLAKDSARLSTPGATAVFRILQEALTNVARHAEAHRVGIRYAVTGRSAVLEVWDDGKGLGQVRAGHTLGILGMLERSRAVGGRTTVRSRLERGTEVRVTVPLGRRRSRPEGAAT